MSDSIRVPGNRLPIHGGNERKWDHEECEAVHGSDDSRWPSDQLDDEI